MIIVGLGVAIYFIVDDAIDSKIEGCLYKHFYTTKLLSKYNVTTEKDPDKIGYSTEECKSIVDQARRKTLYRLDETRNPFQCSKQQLKENYLEDLMLMGASDKFDRQADFRKVYGRISKDCSDTKTS